MSPAAEDILSINGGMARRWLLHIAAVTISFECESVAGGWQPIEAKPALAEAPVVGGIPAIVQNGAVAIKILAVNAEVNVRAELAAVASGREVIQERAAAGAQEGPLGVFGAFGDDVDHAIHRVRPPKSRPGSAHHFDPVDVFQHDVLNVPEDSREKGKIDGAAIHHHQKLVGRRIIKSPGADGPLSRVHLSDLKIWGQAQGL